MRRLFATRAAFAAALCVTSTLGFSAGANADMPAAKPTGATSAPEKDSAPADKSSPARRAPAASAEEERDRVALERFVAVLEKNPQRGTALDRVYGYHVERGSLDALVQSYRDRVEKKPDDAAAWMIIGLLESKRGRDAAAATALAKAEELTPGSALPAYYLGQSLVASGQGDQAVQAFEWALTRKPVKQDLLNIYQALGRVHQRARRNAEALAVWNRLEEQFPDDIRVKEEIAAELVAEQQYDEALKRYTALAERAGKDRNRAVQMKIAAADVKVRLANTAEAIADYEQLLAGLNVESWLYREVRRHIEETFISRDDNSGLAAYYEKWLAAHPDDLDAMTRVARVLGGQGRAAEAQKWLDKAIERAPSRKELRLALIAQLSREKKFNDAIAQYEALDKLDPNNPDYITSWGNLLLADDEKPKEERRKAAAAIWQRLVDARPKDPVTITQVADLLRQNEAQEEAISLYKKAIELSPDASQYREYLGDYYIFLGRKDEGLATLVEIAAPPRRSVENLARLSEILPRYGYLSQGLAAAKDAAALDPRSLDLAMRFGNLLYQDKQFDASLAEIRRAAGIARGEEEQEAVLKQEVEVLTAAGKLATVTDELRAQLDAGTDVTPERLRRLAFLYTATTNSDQALATIERALKQDDKGIPTLKLAARIFESAGDFGRAADLQRKLADLDRRYRTDYLTGVTKLEQRMGRRDRALEAGRDLIAAAPNNGDSYRFFADLCMQLGEQEEGLDTLRRAVRVNPNDTDALLHLATTLTSLVKVEEAIEVYWQAFAKQDDLQARLTTVGTLAELYQQTGQLDRLLERLTAMRQQGDKQREATLCLAAAYQGVQDFGAARRELQGLVTQDQRDTQLITQLATLSEREGDYAAAAKWQQQLVDVAPGREAETKLAQLLLSAGESDQALEVWTKLALDEQDPQRLLQAIDSLLGFARYQAALAVLDKLQREQPGNWELLYRQGVALARMKNFADARQRFHALLALELSDDDLSLAAKSKQGQGNRRAMTATRSTRSFSFPLAERVQGAYQARIEIGLQPESRARVASGQRQSAWMPHDFGQARMAALGYLQKLRQDDGQDDGFTSRVRDEATAANAPPRKRWDFYYQTLVLQNPRETYEAARLLSETKTPDTCWAYLGSLPSRMVASQPRQAVAVDSTPPLPPDEIEHLLACVARLPAAVDYWSMQPLFNAQTELKRADRAEDATRLYEQAVSQVNSPETAYVAFSMAQQRDDFDGAMTQFTRLAELESGAGRIGNSGYLQSAAQSLLQIVDKQAAAKDTDKVCQALDRYLTARRKMATPTRATQRAARSNAAARQNYLVNIGGRYRQVVLDYPVANVYHDQNTIQLLRQAFESLKTVSLDDALVEHFREELKNKEADPSATRLILSYFDWWSEAKPEAIEELRIVCAEANADPGLKLDLAELVEKAGDPAEALKLVEAIEPTDSAMIERRELVKLRCATQEGEVDEARRSAERLFGLRLELEAQLELASHMQQLGMHELSEAVMSRARSQSGNRTTSMPRLMQHYQTQNNMDAAVQIARQIVQKQAPRRAMPGYYSAEDNNRQQALQLLSKAGKLDELIKQAEQRVADSPKSMIQLQTLADFYEAGGKREKAIETMDRVIALKPDDAVLRYQMGSWLMRNNQSDKAVENYLVAIKLDPAVLNNNYEMRRAFQKAKKGDAYLTILEQIDVHSVQPYTIIDAVTNNDSSIDPKRAWNLIHKTCEAYPTQRAYLLTQVHNQAIWNLPEAYEYAHQHLLDPASTGGDVWHPVDHVYSYSQDGQVTGASTRLLDAAAQQGKLAALAEDISKQLDSHPEWRGGRGLLAIIHSRSGDNATAATEVETLLADGAPPIPMNARWIMGQQLEKSPGAELLVMRLYEGGLKEALSTANNQRFSYNPAKRLVEVYKKLERGPEARKLLLDFARQKSNDNYDPRYAAYQQIESAGLIAQELTKIGYPLDAVRLYNELYSQPELFELASNYTNRRDQTTAGYETALRALTPTALASSLGELLTAETGKIAAGQDAIDLMLMLQPPQVDQARLTSLVDAAIESAARDALAPVREGIDRLIAERPSDFSARITATLLAFALAEDAAIDQHLAALSKLTEETPLEDVADLRRLSSRQRAAAAQQIPLWLVARHCWKSEARRTLGDTLANRALDAARQQNDDALTAALRREWGESAYLRGDRELAKARMSEWINDVLNSAEAAAGGGSGNVASKPSANVSGNTAKPAAGGTKTATVDTTGSYVQLAGTSGAKSGETPQPTKPKAVLPTFNQFERISRLAPLAARNGMPELSLECVRRVLERGPPTPTPNQNNNAVASQVAAVSAPAAIRPGRIALAPAMASAANADEVNRAVLDRLCELDELWVAGEAPPAAVYEALCAVIMPESRPGEILPYVQSPSDLLYPRSAARILAAWAVRADKVDDLRKRAADRMEKSEPAARMLLAHVALRAAQPEAAKEQLDRFADMLRKDKMQFAADMAVQAAGEWLASDVAGASAAAALEAAAKNMTKGPVPPLDEIHFALARRAYEHNDLAGAKKQIGAVVGRAIVGKTQGYQNRLEPVLRAATEYVRMGNVTEPLTMLAQVVDTNTPEKAFETSAGGALGSLMRQFSSLPAEERYNLMKTWFMPANRNVLRLAGAFVPVDEIPAAFLPTAPQAPGTNPSVVRAPGQYGVYSTAEVLIAAARDAGKLDDLAAEAQAAVDKKSKGAEVFQALVDLARDKTELAEKIIKERSAERDKSKEEHTDGTVPIEDYFLSIAAMDVEQLRDAGRHLGWLTERKSSNRDYRMHQRYAIAASHDRGDGTPPLAMWLPGTIEAAHLRPSTTPGYWVEAEGYVRQLVEEGPHYLFFKYPLGGSYEFSVESYSGQNTMATPLVGSQLVQRSHLEELVSGNGSPYVHRYQFNRFNVRVESGRVVYSVNDRAVAEDLDPSPTMPWLTIRPGGNTVLQNMSLRGTPEVLPEVKLISGNRLDGWIPGFYLESMPLSKKSVSGLASTSAGWAPTGREPWQDWYAQDGILHGRHAREPRKFEQQVNRVVRHDQSRLYYARPLADGESISYEFLYAPDMIVHPALDRLAFVIEPTGVRLHWLTDDADNEWTSLRGDNIADEPASRRGPAVLALKMNDWNAVTLKLAGGQMSLVLNDVEVFARPMEASNRRQFGFYHQRQQSGVQVRNIVMRGDWPKTISTDAQSNLLVRSAPARNTAASAHLVDENYLVQSAERVWREAMALAPAERYDRLLAWVLPAPDHATWRLEALFITEDDACMAKKDNPNDPAALPAGTVVGPALALVETARELGRLDDLSEQINKAPVPLGEMQRARAAMKTLIACARGRNIDAAAALIDLTRRFQNVSKDRKHNWMWPELLAAHAAAQNPFGRPPAMKLLRQLTTPDRLKVRSTAWWTYALATLAAAERAGEPAPIAAQVGQRVGNSPWILGTRTTAPLHASGTPAARWIVADTLVRHLPGDADCLLYYPRPLTGDFEVEFEIEGLAKAGAQVVLGELALEVRDAKVFTLNRQAVTVSTHVFDEALVDAQGWQKVKLAVSNRFLTAYIQDQKVAEQAIRSDVEPWLAIKIPADQQTAVRNFRISGDPQSPESVAVSLDLTASWYHYHDGDSTLRSASGWSVRQDEMVGNRVPAVPGANVENLLVYRRPLFGDCRLNYEFFYSPGESIVHPALDRQALLLAPEGVRPHCVSDGIFDRREHADAAVAASSGSSTAVPLHAGEWNKATIALAGDRVTLEVNGTLVYDSPLDPTSRRTFGLFHYADHEQSRVRNMTCSGQWSAPAAAFK